MADDSVGQHEADDREFVNFASVHARIAQSINDQWSRLGADIASSIVVPKIDVPRLDVASYFADFSAATEAGAAASAVADAVSRQIAHLVGFNEAITQAMAPYAELWADVFASLRSLRTEFFPDNLQAVLPDKATLETLLVDEGIPLMWVPRAEAIEALSNAPDSSARRRMIGSRWKGVVSDCEAVLLSITHVDLKDSRLFALDCVRALRDGHANAAQALAANLLDTLMRRHFDSSMRVMLTKNELKKKGIKFDLDAYKIRISCTFAPVWCAHAEYWPKNGDPIPRVFGRHPSAHGVSRNQYSRINATIGLMLVASVLKFFDLELPE